MNTTNRSNGADRPVRVITVFADGHVSHRDLSKGRAPWTKGAAWGRPGAHALPSEGPGETAPAVKAKDPRKVAAGKARAAQAKAAREAAREAAQAPSPMKAAAVTLVAVAAKKAPVKAVRAKKGEPKGPGPNAMVVMAVRVTPAQKAKYDKLGAEWLRARIEAATVQPGKRK